MHPYQSASSNWNFGHKLSHFRYLHRSPTIERGTLLKNLNPCNHYKLIYIWRNLEGVIGSGWELKFFSGGPCCHPNPASRLLLPVGGDQFDRATQRWSPPHQVHHGLPDVPGPPGGPGQRGVLWTSTLAHAWRHHGRRSPAGRHYGAARNHSFAGWCCTIDGRCRFYD